MDVDSRYNKNLHKKIRNKIEVQVLFGILQNENFLPSEAEMCRIYGVSRTTIRRAYIELKEKGFITAEPRNGTRIAISNTCLEDRQWGRQN